MTLTSFLIVKSTVTCKTIVCEKVVYPGGGDGAVLVVAVELEVALGSPLNNFLAAGHIDFQLLFPL